MRCAEVLVLPEMVDPPRPHELAASGVGGWWNNETEASDLVAEMRSRQ